MSLVHTFWDTKLVWVWCSLSRSSRLPAGGADPSNPTLGPLQRFTEGKTVTIDMHNDTGTPKQLHWHGQTLPVNVDGSADECASAEPHTGYFVTKCLLSGPSSQGEVSGSR